MLVGLTRICHGGVLPDDGHGCGVLLRGRLGVTWGREVLAAGEVYSVAPPPEPSASDNTYMPSPAICDSMNRRTGGIFAQTRLPTPPVLLGFAFALRHLRQRTGGCPVRRMRLTIRRAKATRKPRLLFRLSGLFLLRFADRQFLALLFQLPPRFTRFEPTGNPPNTQSVAS